MYMDDMTDSELEPRGACDPTSKSVTRCALAFMLRCCASCASSCSCHCTSCCGLSHACPQCSCRSSCCICSVFRSQFAVVRGILFTSFELFWSTLHLTHHFLDLGKNLQRGQSWEFCHSNSIVSPSIPSYSLYCFESLNHCSLDSHSTIEIGF